MGSWQLALQEWQPKHSFPFVLDETLMNSCSYWTPVAYTFYEVDFGKKL